MIETCGTYQNERDWGASIISAWCRGRWLPKIQHPPIHDTTSMHLGPTTERRIASLAAAYSRHRPLFQRSLTAAFVFYAISTTYNGLFSNNAPSSQSGKRKGKERAQSEGEGSKRPVRVAVGICVVFNHTIHRIRHFCRLMRFSAKGYLEYFA